MPIFVYTARPLPGKIEKGRIEAESRQDAIRKLTGQGRYPIDLSLERSIASPESWRRLPRPSRKEIARTIQQLSVLIGSGINIIGGLRLLAAQQKNLSLKNALEDIMARVKNGASLSEGFKAHPGIFPPVYAAMVHAGEVGGHIEVSLGRLSEFLEKEDEFKESLKGAMVYPAFILSLSIVTIIVLLVFVIPRMAGIFEDMGQMLPLPTKILLGLSHWFGRAWGVLLGIVGMAFFLLRRALMTIPGRRSFDAWKLRVPLWGAIVLKAEVGGLLRTLALLLSSGIPILSALDLSACVINNEVLREDVEETKTRIAQGSTFSGALSRSRFIPDLTRNIIHVGEESGILEKALLRVAQEYERDVDRSLKNFIRVLEPLIILCMGIIVGFIVFSMLLPIFQINMVVS